MSDDISADKKTLEAVDLISSTTIMAVVYTFSAILYYRCARLSYYQAWDLDGKIKKRMLFTFGLTSVMIICATLDVVLINHYMEIVYIDYSHLPGGPLGVQAQLHTVTVAIIDLVVALIEEIVATGVLVWRVWVVWSGTRYFVPITTLSLALYLAYTVSYTLNIVVAFSNFIPNFATTPQLSKIVVIMTLGLSSASTIFMTSVVILRLMLVRWQHIKAMGRTEASAHYLSIAAMLVESYALMTTWTIANLIFYIARDAHAGSLVNNLVVQIRVLSYLLVAYRVFAGRAWERQTGHDLSTIQWNRGARPVTDVTTGAVSQREIHLEAKPSTLSSRADV